MHDLTASAAAPSLPGPRPVLLRAVPSPLGRKVLAFEFVVLLEYFVAPLFLGITNYAGTWSEVGSLLFFVFVGTLLAFVVWPLWPHLRATLTTRGRRVVFHGVWVTSFVIGLFVTNILQFVDATTTGPLLFGQSTIYTPFGAWPSLTIYVPPIQLWATFNIEAPTILALLSILSAASIMIGTAIRPKSCPPQTARSGSWRARLASIGILSPLGFITGCAGCAPAYFTLLAVIAPGTAVSAYASVPLVPWIGFAGLLYLFGFWLAVRLIHRATSDLVRLTDNPTSAG